MLQEVKKMLYQDKTIQAWKIPPNSGGVIPEPDISNKTYLACDIGK